MVLARGAVGFGVRALRAFDLDQLGEPADLAVDGLERVLVQLTGVAVEPLAGPRRAAHAVATFLDLAPPALEHLEPDVGAGLGEEREPGAEALVVEGIGADRGEQVGQVPCRRR